MDNNDTCINSNSLAYDKGYNAGVTAAWSLAFNLADSYSEKDIIAIFGEKCSYDVLRNHTGSGALQCIKNYNDRLNLNLGDEVTCGQGSIGVVTNIKSDIFNYI